MAIAEKRRLLIITNRLVIGGPTKDILATCAILKNNFEIIILSGFPKHSDKIYPIPSELSENISIHYIKNLNSSFNFIDTAKAYYEIKKEIARFNPHIVHTHCAKPGLLGRLAAKSAGVNKVFHTFHGHFFHSYFNKLVSGVIILVERYLATKCTKIISLSNRQAHDLAITYKIVPEKKLTIIPLGISLDKFTDTNGAKRNAFRKKYNLAEDQIAIGIVARTSPVKNHKLFLDIAIALTKQKQFKFFIIGDGDKTDSLKKYLAAQNIQYADNKHSLTDESIIFTSWYVNIAEVHFGLDIELLTSFNEGTPLSIIEAMACGTPVIAANVGGVADLIEDKKTGLLVNELSTQIFINTIDLLLSDKLLQQQIREASIKFAYSKFSVQKEALQLEELYKA